MDTSRLRELLARSRDVSGWFLNHAAIEEVSVLRVPRIYSVRSGELVSTPNPAPREVIIAPSETAQLTVYSRFSSAGQDWLGDASGQLLSDREPDVDRTVAQLVAAAQSQRNKPFPLPGQDKSGAPLPLLADPELTSLSWSELQARAQAFNERVITATGRHDGVAVSNLEIFIRRHRCRFLSATGIQAEFPSTRVRVELCFLARPDTDQAGEHTARLSSRRFADLDPVAIVDEYARAARMVALASAPSEWHGPVVLEGEAVADAFDIARSPLAFHTSARMVYEKSARHAPGRPLSDAPLKGEPLNVVSDPLIPFGLRSLGLSDQDGLPCRRVTLARNGCFDGLLGSQRYFHYLGLLEQGIEPPGTIGNTVIPAGARTEQELIQGDGVVIHAFSSWEVDSSSGDFACEVRLGELRRNRKTLPFKGGLLIGNWFAALADVGFSRELQRSGSFYGPRAVRFGDLHLAT
jgi:predicted Zn-dependent protease